MRAVPISHDDIVIAERYVLGGLLGRGGMAEVRAGTDRRLDRPVAIKWLRPEMAAREDVRNRFATEARLAARLCHPSAVAVYDTGEHLGSPYIVMERLPGETLADNLRNGPIDAERVRSVALDVLGALTAAHALGIVHRDVKPANVLITTDGRAKLSDFGIAKTLNPADEIGGACDSTGSGRCIGTPAYLAPERLDGAPASPRSDIYSLGVVLYEALTGFKPFTGDSPVAEAAAVVRRDHQPLLEVRPDLDPGLAAIVERAMAAQPAHRFASATEMADALTDRCDDSAAATTDVALATAPEEHTQVLDTNLQEPSTAPNWRSRKLLAGAAALVGVAVVAVFALAGNGDPSPSSATDAGPPAVADPAPVIDPPRQVPATGAVGNSPPATAAPAGVAEEPLDIGSSRGKGKSRGGQSGESSGKED